MSDLLTVKFLCKQECVILDIVKVPDICWLLGIVNSNTGRWQCFQVEILLQLCPVRSDDSTEPAAAWKGSLKDSCSTKHRRAFPSHLFQPHSC